MEGLPFVVIAVPVVWEIKREEIEAKYTEIKSAAENTVKPVFRTPWEKQIGLTFPEVWKNREYSQN